MQMANGKMECQNAKGKWKMENVKKRDSEAWGDPGETIWKLVFKVGKFMKQSVYG
jgi:hypothetical protein